MSVMFRGISCATSETSDLSIQAQSLLQCVQAQFTMRYHCEIRGFISCLSRRKMC